MDPTRWPDVSNDSLTRDLDDWLMPHVGSVRSMDTLADIDLASLLLNRLSWKDRSELDRLAPERYETPAGTRIAIDYDDPAAPVLAVKLQEMFGLADTPSVADGRVTLTLHLLSPAGRPVQITRDLRGFWRTSYFDVRKDLRGRYPKHDWPDDPMTARPTRGARRRR